MMDAKSSSVVVRVICVTVDVAADGLSFRFREPVDVPGGHSVTMSGPPFSCDENRWANAGGEATVTLRIERSRP
jgi:hypothetical protein